MTAFTVPATSVIVVGASAGGISAVRTLLNKFPESIPAAPRQTLTHQGLGIRD